jgi:hypothetical protein
LNNSFFLSSAFQEKQKKQEEIKRLKNLKRKEIMDKIEQLKRITGNENVGFSSEDLDGNFNPQEYDELMQVTAVFLLPSLGFLW